MTPVLIRTLAALAVAAVAQPALALSCLPPDAVRLYEMARDADETYLYLRGRVEVTGPAITLVPDNTRDQTATTTARVTGFALGVEDFASEIDREVTLTVFCLGPWCGGTEGLSGEQFMALGVNSDTLTLEVGPCGGDLVAWDPDGEARLLTCHRGGACEMADF